MARARKVELDCEASFGIAAARVVEIRAEEVFARAEGVLDLDDVERVHDMRVATRRLRAALEVFEVCFPRKRWRKALKRVKVLAGALGARRDLDVEIELLEGLVAEVAIEDAAKLATLIGESRVRQRRANDALAPFVAGEQMERLHRRIAKLVEAVGE